MKLCQSYLLTKLPISLKRYKSIMNYPLLCDMENTQPSSSLILRKMKCRVYYISTYSQRNCNLKSAISETSEISEVISYESRTPVANTLPSFVYLNRYFPSLSNT